VYTAVRAQINRCNNVQFSQAKSLMQHSVGFSFASQSFSIAVNIGGKLQWTGFASTYRNQQNTF